MKTRHVGFRVTEEQYERLRAEAVRRGVATSVVLRELIDRMRPSGARVVEYVDPHDEATKYIYTPFSEGE